MDAVFKILTLLGSLGLFLYGMTLMSEALQKVAGDKLRNILAAMTSNSLSRILTGLFITAVMNRPVRILENELEVIAARIFLNLSPATFCRASLIRVIP